MEGQYRGSFHQGRLSRRRLVQRSALAGAGFGAALLAGCGRSTSPSRGETRSASSQPGQAGSAATAKPGGTLNPDTLQGNLPSLDTQQTSSGFTMNAASFIMSRLFMFKTGTDPKVGLSRDIEGDLALNVESPDAITWTVKLRADAKFHNLPPVNGHRVEAEDIKSTFTRGLGQSRNPYLGALGVIDQITTPAVDTVVFKLKYPYGPFRKFAASSSYAWILPREALAGAYDPAKQIIGSGPFIFDSHTPDVAVTARKNGTWHVAGLPYADGVRLGILPDPAQRIAQFTGGHLDSLGVLPKDMDSVRRDNPKAAITTNPPSGGAMIWFQLGTPASPWQDVRLRQAISMALDRDALGKALFQGDAEPFFNVPADFGKWAITMDQLPSNAAQYYRYNPAEAKKLLSAAGAASLTVKLGYPSPYPVQGFSTFAETVSSMLNAVGLKTSLTSLDYTSVYLNSGKGIRYGNFDSDMIVLAGLESTNDADDYLYNYFYSEASTNQEHLRDTALDGMLSKARTSTNEDDRAKALLDAQKYIADKMYTVAGLPSARAHTAVQPWVQNYQLIPGHGIGAETWAKAWLNK